MGGWMPAWLPGRLVGWLAGWLGLWVAGCRFVRRSVSEWRGGWVELSEAIEWVGG